MAVTDRIEPAYTAWTPSAAGIATEHDGTDSDYVGRHRRPEARRGFSLHTIFYTARHRSR